MPKFSRSIVAYGLAVMSAQALADSLTLSDAWVRALPPVQKVTAGYVTVSNTSDSPIVLTGGASPVASKVEIHTTKEVDGYMRMQPVPELLVPAGGEVSLAPGGDHLMLMGLERMPVDGEEVQICLTTKGGDTACTAAQVRRDDKGGHHHH